MSHYREDKARAKAKDKLDTLDTARDTQMRKYHAIYKKLADQMGLDEVLELFCRCRDSVMYTNWCNNGVYFLSDDNVRRVFNNTISAMQSEEDRICRPSFAKNFG